MIDFLDNFLNHPSIKSDYKSPDHWVPSHLMAFINRICSGSLAPMKGTIPLRTGGLLVPGLEAGRRD